jgi:Flp pilus assembly protein TadD
MTFNDYSIRGIEAMNNGNDEQAIADFTQAIKIDPDNEFPYTSRGIIY